MLHNWKWVGGDLGLWVICLNIELIYDIVFEFSEIFQNEITILLSIDVKLTYLIPYVWRRIRNYNIYNIISYKIL